MIIEVAELLVEPQDHAAFEAAVLEALPLFRAAEGMLDIKLWKSDKNAKLYRLVVQWRTKGDHVERFQKSEAFSEWRRLVGRYFAEPPKVDHNMVRLSG